MCFHTTFDKHIKINDPLNPFVGPISTHLLVQYFGIVNIVRTPKIFAPCVFKHMMSFQFAHFVLRQNIRRSQQGICILTLVLILLQFVKLRTNNDFFIYRVLKPIIVKFRPHIDKQIFCLYNQTI